jgi:hypothetical protein
MMGYIRILVCGLALQCSAAPALANWQYTPGTGGVFFRSFNSGTTPAGTSACAAASTDCLANVPIDTTGSPMFVTGNAGLVTGTGGTFPVTQATASSLNATVVGTGTFAAQLTGATNNINNIAGTISLPTGAATSALQTTGNTALTTINTTLGSPFQAGGSIGNTTFAVTNAGTFAAQLTGATNNINNIAGTISLPTGAATSALQTTGNTALNTINTTLNSPMQNSGGSVTANAGTNLNTSALATSANQTNASQKTQIVDGSGNIIASTSNNLNVQCSNCSGSGVSAADAATFTAGTSLMAPVGAQYTSGGATACVTGHECTLGATSARGLFTDVSSIAGTATSTGNGTQGAGTQRVVIASDNTAFAVNATLQAAATTAIGKVDPNTAANWGLGATGSAVPANAQYIGIVSGGNLTGWTGAVTNAGTFAVQATLQASATTAIGKVDPNTIATWGLMSGTTPGTAPTNTAIVGAIYNSSAPTATTGQTLPLQTDASGNLLVNIKAGAGSGGTASADQAAWTQGTTSGTQIQGEYTSGGATACSTAKSCTVALTSDRSIFTNMADWAGTALGAPSNYGTSPGAVTVPGVNAFVTNTNTNGSATSANSSPVVIASDQAAVAVKLNATPTIANGNGVVPTIGGAVYSATNGAYFNQLQGNAVLSATNGGYQNLLQGNAVISATNGLYVLPTTAAIFPVSAASGSIASGAVASGAFTSGSIGSGAIASGAVASGAFASGAIGSGAVASGAFASGAFAAGSFLNATAGDACMFANKTNLAISQNGTSSVQLIALSGSTSIYVCSLSLIAAGATTVAITTGTGTACVTGNAAVIGSTTANIANSISLAANGGLTLGNGGGTVAKGAASSELCMILGTSVFVSGNLTYVQI